MPDLHDLPMERFCNFIWYYLTRNAGKQSDIDKLKTRLWRPPPGQVAKKGPWTAEAETAAFQSLKAALKR